jgi:uncharacterized protein (TIGR03067 family)
VIANTNVFEKDDQEGKWELTSETNDGKEEPSDTKLILTFESGSVTQSKGSVIRKYQYSIDATQSPKRVVFVSMCESKEVKLNFIFQIEDKKLKLCSEDKSDGDFPKEFESKAGSKRILLILKKQD